MEENKDLSKDIFNSGRLGHFGTSAGHYNTKLVKQLTSKEILPESDIISELEKLRDIKDYSMNQAINTGYRAGILDSIDLIGRYLKTLEKQVDDNKEVIERQNKMMLYMENSSLLLNGISLFDFMNKENEINELKREVEELKEIIRSAHIITGPDAESFLEKISNPKPVSAQEKERIRKSFEWLNKISKFDI